MRRRDFPMIRLASWEHLPHVPQDIDERAQHVMPFEWAGRRFKVAARMACVGFGKDFIFARFIDIRDEANWVLGLGRYYDGPQIFSAGTQLKLSKRLESKARSRYFPFGHLFYFGASELGTQKAYYAYIGINGSARCLEAEYSDDFGEGFWLSGGQSLVDVPAREVHQRLLAEVAREDSDAAFALRWHEMEAVERENLIYGVKRGSMDELRRVLKGALCIEPMVQTQNASWSWLIPKGDTSTEANEGSLSSSLRVPLFLSGRDSRCGCGCGSVWLWLILRQPSGNR